MASSDAVIEDMDIAVDTENSREYELARMRHSAAHLMAEAVQEVFPDAKFGIGPAIENGLYYDFDLPRPLTPDDLSDIEARMRKHQKADDFERNDVSRDEALETSAATRTRSRSSRSCPRTRRSRRPQGEFLDLARAHSRSTKQSGRQSPERRRRHWRGASTADAQASTHGVADAAGLDEYLASEKAQSATTASSVASSISSRSPWIGPG